MTEREAKERIEKLKKLIKYHRYLYHVLDKEEISDDALDSLKHELYKLEQQFPQFITPDSPTQRVGGKPLKIFRKVHHKVPMLSIEDVFSEEELREWERYIKKLVPGEKINYFAELKIDGFAITLLYEKGLFVLGATRGDGKTGEDVTQNLKTIESIPLRLELHSHPYLKLSPLLEKNLRQILAKGKIEIRGEVYMRKDDFQRFNQKLKKEGKKIFSNPRNLAAGSIRQLDPKLAASRPLNFLAYDIVTDFGQEKHSQEHQALPLLGFKTDEGRVCQNLGEVLEYWQKVKKEREKLPFQIDGVVVNVNSNRIFQKLGVAGKSPRGVRALKFPPHQATTIVKNIKLQVGRTGALTPVAILKPVNIGGVVVSRATLHNEEEIKRLGLKIGDTVIVGRAGDVIPDVIKVLPQLRTGKERVFKMPKKCPFCGTPLVRKKGETIWYCPNPHCFARRRRYLYHFVSKKAFDIEGLGPKVIDKFLSAGLIGDAADIFSLKKEDIQSLEGFREKSAQNIIHSIEKRKTVSLPKFIYALGIRNVGEKTAFLLAEHFLSLERLASASKEELENIRDIGKVVADSIYYFFREKRNLDFIKKLRRLGLLILAEKKRRGRKPLKGKRFVFTGILQSMTRDEAKEKVSLLGGETSNSLSKNTTFLVLGENPGSKLERAKKLGVKIIKEKVFLRLINENKS